MLPIIAAVESPLLAAGTAETMVEILRLLLSPQMAVVAIVWFFRSELRECIQYMSFKLPGGIEVTQKDRAEKTPTDALELLKDAEKLPQTIDLETARNMLQAERANAALWEYRFLNLFLVPHTLFVLRQLAGLKSPLTITLYDSYYMSMIPNSDERKAVLAALQNHHLVQLNGDLIEVTPKGQEYLRWRQALSLDPAS